MNGVARDVLDHASAGAGDRAVAEREAGAEDPVDRRAEAQPPRARCIRGQHAAERGNVGTRAFERQLLPARGERGAQRVERDAALGRERKVVGVVFDDGLERRHIERDVVARRRRDHVQRNAAAPRNDFQIVTRGGA